MTDWIYLNGEFHRGDVPLISINDRGFLYGDGLFETLRAYDGALFRFDRHLQRMRAAADQIFLPIEQTDESIQSAALALLEKNQLQDGIVRIQITRGITPAGPSLPDNPSPTVLIQSRPLRQLPDGAYSNGVAACVIPNGAITNPPLAIRIKSCNYLPNILARRKAEECGVFESILLDGDGRVTEGSISNVFIVNQGILYTAPAGPAVLPGITRETVIELAQVESLPVEETPFTEEMLCEADEVFLTNSAIEVLPVTRIESQPVGTGEPGDITRTLAQLYSKTVEEEGRSC